MRKGKNPWFDSWAKKAKERGYPARSVFKLEEMQKRFKVLKPGDLVLDLGCSPGSWSKFALEVAGKRGFVVGIDLKKPTISHERFLYLMADVFEVDWEKLKEIPQVKERKGFDVVLSDMAPNTTGDSFVDHIRCYRLARRAFEIALECLKPGGNFVVKVFEGEKIPSFKLEVKKHFKGLKFFKPRASRKESKEIYLVALNKLK